MIIGVIVVAVLNSLRNSKNEKIRENATKISQIVEDIYRGCTASEKLQAFKDLCKNRGVNIKKAVNFLEKYIIPISNTINVFTPSDTNNDNDQADSGLE